MTKVSIEGESWGGAEAGRWTSEGKLDAHRKGGGGTEPCQTLNDITSGAIGSKTDLELDLGE